MVMQFAVEINGRVVIPIVGNNPRARVPGGMVKIAARKGVIGEDPIGEPRRMGIGVIVKVVRVVG